MIEQERADNKLTTLFEISVFSIIKMPACGTIFLCRPTISHTAINSRFEDFPLSFSNMFGAQNYTCTSTFPKLRQGRTVLLDHKTTYSRKEDYYR